MKTKIIASLFLVVILLLLTPAISLASVLGSGCTTGELEALIQKYNARDMYAAATAEINQANAEIKALEETTGLASTMLPRIAQLKAEWNNKIYITQLKIQNTETVINGICSVNARSRTESPSSDFTGRQNEMSVLQAKIDILKQEQRKSAESYQRILDGLDSIKISQYSCPPNSTLSGNNCPCNEGYVSNASGLCVTYTQSCQSVNNNDQKIVGVKGGDGKINCNCTSGYTWNGSQCTVINSATVDVPTIVPKTKTVPKVVEIPAKVSSGEKDLKQVKKTPTVVSSPTIEIATSTKSDTIKTSWFGKIWKFVWRF